MPYVPYTVCENRIYYLYADGDSAYPQTVAKYFCRHFRTLGEPTLSGSLSINQDGGTE